MRQLGYTGKTPHRGDFVRHNVPVLLHDRWDDWLSETLLEAGRTIADWPASYDAAPVWRFAFSADIAGEDARAGVLIATRDSVGRHYPFTVFATLDVGTTPLDALADDALLGSLESLAREALADAERYDALKAALDTLQHAMPPPTGGGQGLPFHAGAATHVDEPAVYCEDACLLQDRAGTRRLLDAVLRQGTGPYSVWRRDDTPTTDGRLIVTGGLPQGGAALALFGADWSSSAGGRLEGRGRSDTRRPGAPSTDETPTTPRPYDDTPTARSPAVLADEAATDVPPAPDATPTRRRQDATAAARALGAGAVEAAASPSLPDPVAAGREIAEAFGIDEDENGDAPWDPP